MSKTLGIDPGTSNFAVVSLGKTVLEARMVQATVKDLKTPGAARKQLGVFALNLWPLLLAHDQVICERYMNRGVRSATGELVNLMIGNLLTRKDMLLVPAVTWKNAVNRVFNLNVAYKAFACPPHLLDALLLALYARDKTMSIDFKQLVKYMNQIQELNPELCRNIVKKPGRLADLKASFVQ